MGVSLGIGIPYGYYTMAFLELGAGSARQVAEWGLAPSRFGRLVAAHHTDSLPFMRSRRRLVRATSRRTLRLCDVPMPTLPGSRGREGKKKLALPNCRLVPWKCEAVSAYLGSLLRVSRLELDPAVTKRKVKLPFQSSRLGPDHTLGGQPWYLACSPRGLMSAVRQLRTAVER